MTVKNPTPVPAAPVPVQRAEVTRPSPVAVPSQPPVSNLPLDKSPAPVPPGPGTGTNPNANVTITIPVTDVPVSANVIPNTSGANNVMITTTRPGGNTGAIQFNNNGTFAGVANLTFNGSTIANIGYGVPLLTTMYNSLAGGILNTTGEARVGNINTTSSSSGTAGFARLRYQRSGPVPGGYAGQVAFYGFKAKDNQFSTLTFENNQFASVAMVMGATPPYDASGVPAYVGYGGDGTVFGISGSIYAGPGYGNRVSNGGADEYWRPLLNLDGRGNLNIGGGITMTPPAFRPWFTAGGRSDPDGPAVNCGITFADGTFQNTAYQGSSPVGATVNIKEEGVAVVSSNTINFVGSAVTASNVSGVATITVTGLSGISITEDGYGVVPSANAVNFTGAGVTASNVSGVATITIPGGVSGITVKEEGTNVVSAANTVNFVGAGVTASNVSGVATITIPGSSSGITVQEEGSNVVASTSTINFVGAGVTASNVSGVATVTVTGSSDTVYNKGNVSGNTAINLSDGTIQTCSLVGNTVFDISSVTSSKSITLLLTQYGIPAASIDFNSVVRYAAGYKTLSSAYGAIDMLNIVNIGGSYYATLTVGYTT